MDDALVRALILPPAPEGAPRIGHPWDLPAVAALERELTLHPKVTYLVGENGSGKSTLMEALATAAGINAEGGTSNFSFSTRDARSELGETLRLIRGPRRSRTDFFLRAESLFTAATYLDELAAGDPGALQAYGGRSLHEQSHGESFLAVLLHRLGPGGFYLLDEPEAALSTQNCLTALARIHELVNEGSQFVIATHSPIVLAYPDAAIYACTEDGLEQVEYEDCEPVRLTRAFLGDPGRFLDRLLG